MNFNDSQNNDNLGENENRPTENTNLYQTPVSFTPEPSFVSNGQDGFIPDETPKNENVGLSDNPFSGQESVNTRSFTPSASQFPDTPVKKKKSVTMGSVIAVAVICAIISSILTTAVFYSTGLFDSKTIIQNLPSSNNSSENSSQTVNIETAENVSTAEAVAAKCISSIVGIRVTTTQTYWSWFGEQTGKSTGEGSGVILSQDGYIITNYHVISNAVTSSSAKIEVFFPNDIENGISAKIIGYTVNADIAVIKIDKTGLSPIEMGDSDSLVLGQTALAIGNPGGIQYIGSISQGIISGLNRSIYIENIGNMTLIQTDTAINPGNSGGALVNSEGKLIGIVSSKIVSEEFEGLGFAIPVNTARAIAEGIIKNPDSSKAYVGIYISSEYDAETLKSLGYPAGIVIENVVENGPADNAGLKRGDIITKVEDKETPDKATFSSLLKNFKPGVTLKFTIYRNGRYYSTSVTLGESN